MVNLSWPLTQEGEYEHHMCTQGSVVEDNKAVLTNTACIVNSLIHNEIKRQSTVRQEFSTNPSSFSIDNELNNTNQLLLEFVNRSTATVREKKTKH